MYTRFKSNNLSRLIDIGNNLPSILRKSLSIKLSH